MAEELSVWQLVADASLTVQAVMLILFIASVVSWFMIVQRAFYFRACKQALNNFEQQFWSGMDLSQLFRQGSVQADSTGASFVGM
ncbi:hypothetical protein LCGC14_0276830, partial [marine sediment metagenome]